MRLTIALALCLGAAACSTINPPPPVYVVFFDGTGITLTATGRTIVDHAAADAKANGASMVEITGPSTKEAPGYNPALAEPRMHAVEDALIADGIAASRLVRTSLTTGGAEVGAGGDRRVEIRLTGKPAS